MLMVEIFLSTGAMKCLRATPSCSSKDKDISDYQSNRITALFAVTEKRVSAEPGCKNRNRNSQLSRWLRTLTSGFLLLINVCE